MQPNLEIRGSEIKMLGGPSVNAGPDLKTMRAGTPKEGIGGPPKRQNIDAERDLLPNSRGLRIKVLIKRRDPRSKKGLTRSGVKSGVATPAVGIQPHTPGSRGRHLSTEQ